MLKPTSIRGLCVAMRRPLCALLLMSVAVAVAAAPAGAADLTRASGLYDYNGPPGPRAHDLQNPYGAPTGRLPRRIRIALARNLSFANGDRLEAPELSYYGALSVGTPGKLFNVVFDTASSETWLPYYNWFPLANNLHYSEGYKCGDSSTCHQLKRDYKLDYRRTSMSGESYEDRFTLFEDMNKEDAQVLVAQQISFKHNFLGIESAGDEQFRYKPYDGVVGLAPVAQSGSGLRNMLLSMQLEYQRELASGQTEPSQQQALQQQMQWPAQSSNPGGQPYPDYSSSYYQQSNQPELLFSFWFNPNQNSRHGGELMLGGVDENRFQGDIHFHRINSWFDWQLPLTYVTLGGQLVSCNQGCSARLDTGANSIVGPRQDVDEIYSSLQAQFEPNGKLWIVDCNRIDQYPALVFKIEDTAYTIMARHYVRMFRHRDTVVCHLAIKPWDGPNWLLGTSFVGAYYTVFDFASRRVGFATPRG